MAEPTDARQALDPLFRLALSQLVELGDARRYPSEECVVDVTPSTRYY